MFYLTSRWNKNHLFSFTSSHLIDYPTPINLTYFWSFGAVAGICLVMQIFTGIFLAMHYNPHVDLAFNSVEHIMKDVNNGWLIRYLHSNVASVFFVAAYCHIFRGIYFGSYGRPKAILWATGVIMFLLMMATAFLGYILPWGQMSFWGATVITNLFSAIPFVGTSIVEWLWGGFSVDNATLNRFFSLHYLMPFLIIGMLAPHLALLHSDGSNNPTGVTAKELETIDFYPYYYAKDLFVFLIILLFISFLVYFFPNVLGHTDNSVPANSLVTPTHIVPEWYFLPFYAILRSVPDKLGGVVAMISAILVLLVLPAITKSSVINTKYRPIFRFFFWILLIDFLILGWIGQQPVEDPYVSIGMCATLLYFSILVVFLPLLGFVVEVYSKD